jgi:hypothetical protein
VWTIVYFCTNMFRRLIHGSARNMVSTFLNGRSIVVDVDGARSSPRALFSGVPKGSVPSPLFFLCLSIVCPNVFVIRNLIFMLMTYKFICRGISLIWMAWSLEWIRILKPSISENGLLLNTGKSPPELPLPWLFLGDIALEGRCHWSRSLDWESIVLCIDCDFWCSWSRRLSGWSFARLFFCHIVFSSLSCLDGRRAPAGSF